MDIHGEKQKYNFKKSFSKNEILYKQKKGISKVSTLVG